MKRYPQKRDDRFVTTEQTLLLLHCQLQRLD